MAYIVNVAACECAAECVPICPTHCIEIKAPPGETRRAVIDAGRCTDCAACLSVCSIEGGILPSDAADHQYRWWKGKTLH